MGEPEGYRRIYLDEGSRLYDLLVRCQTAQEKSNSYLPSASFIDSLLQSIQHDDQPHRVQHLSSAIAPEVRTTTVDGGFAISLSSREIEVLNLIAEGKSNKEISAELYLALNTVKRHAYNIYNKLDVSRRTQAVSKARQLGLIP
ncbi:MAG: response regulator transcription factor [Anaerolineaceae bacterium]|nr:response regulator transcription factor [Anaerolineaceae bacterium]